MTSNWYLHKGGLQSGPFSWEELYRQAKGGFIRPTDMVWTEGMIAWAPAEIIRGLFISKDSVQVQEHPPPPQSGQGPPQFPLGSAQNNALNPNINYNDAAAPPPQPVNPAYPPGAMTKPPTGTKTQKGKGGMIALVIIIALLVFGGVVFAAYNILLSPTDGGGFLAGLFDRDQEGSLGADPSVSTEQSQAQENRLEVDLTGLWAPPLDFAGTKVPGDYQYERMQELIGDMPSRDEIPYTPYPGAYFGGYSSPQQLSEGSSTKRAVTMVSSDSKEDVFNYYSNQFPNWQTSVSEVNIILWPAEEGGMMDAFGYLIPAILISDADNFDREWSHPAAQSIIQMMY